MNNIRLTEIGKDAIELFNNSRKVLKGSSIAKLQSKAEFVPDRLIDEGKKIRIVFAGQYSAGKSSILSYMTGQQLEVGQGVTTSICNYLDWNGVEVVDTPGIHTQKRPDHDKITYEAMAEADLIVFVCTVEGFSEGLGAHFRKLLVEKGKGNEMMLVFNKMENSKYGNTEEGQKEFFEKDVLPVISPEFSAEDLYISYIDTYAYEDALDADGIEKEGLLKMSGYDKFYANINKFIADKKVLGKCTTSLYKLEQMLSEAMSEFTSGDFCSDGSLHLLNQQRRMLIESKDNIKSKSYSIVREETQNVRNWGYTIADELTSADSGDKVNAKLKEKYDETDSVYEKAAKEIEKVINLESESLSKKISDLGKTEFVCNLKSAIEHRIGEIKIDENTSGHLPDFASKVMKSGEWLSKMAMGPNASSGWQAIFKLGSYSGSKAHEAVLTVGHFFGKKFKPWEAVKMAGKIGKAGKILGVGGCLLGVAVQIWQDKQDEKMEKQLLQYRSEIRNIFTEAANVIDLQFDEDTQMWIEANIDPEIQKIDDNIKLIEESVNIQQQEYEDYRKLLNRTRELISQIQEASIS